MPRFPLAAALLGAWFAMAPPSEAGVVRYQSVLAPEVAGATGSGSVTVDHDTLAHTLLVSATWSGLSGTTTVAHIHCCTAVPGTGTINVAVTPNTLPGFPAGVSSGSYISQLLDLTAAPTYTSAFINNFAGGLLGNAEAALIAGFDAGEAYFNVHTTTFPAGEIRGFLRAAAEPVPEPATLALLALGLAGIGWGRRVQHTRA